MSTPAKPYDPPMGEFVRITDVSPRDGLQNERGVIPTAEKARLIELLIPAGLDEIELTSFVNPKAIPQLADAADLLRLIASPSRREGFGVGLGGVGRDRRWTSPARMRTTLRNAKVLRKAMTGPEHALWEYLRRREVIGYKFRRQHPFGPYILDFYCHEKRLAVELDGRTHADEVAQRHDAQRDIWVAEQGVRTIRVSNDRVIADPLSVVDAIRAELGLPPGRRERRERRTRGRSGEPTPNPSLREGLEEPMYSVLVPNERGLHGLLDAQRSIGHRFASKVSLFTAASESFTKRNINATIAESIERFRPVVSRALDEGFLIRAYVSTVIACPFEGPVAPDAVLRVVDDLIALGVDEIDLGDTIGAATPETTTQLLDAFRARLGDEWFDEDRLTLHFHDTFGRAADCVRAALAAGVRSFDGSVAGLGGCPYAGTPEKPAPGNIATETLVRTIHDAGFATNVDLDALAEAATYAREIVARARAAAPTAAAPQPPTANA